jgi:hypothetical protein
VTSTASRFEARTAPCGRVQDGEELVTEDLQGLATRDVRFACGCQTHHEEYHDGSVHNQVVNHHGRVVVDEELRGE